MSALADYTSEEQQLLLRSLQATAVLVSAASMGRKTETFSEGFAAANLIMARTEATAGNALITSVQFALEQRAEHGQPFPDYEKVASATGAAEDALATLRAVIALLAVKATPEEALGYRQWLMSIAQATAAAGKEGGNFLGWGAVQINDAEQAALQQLAQVLDVTA
ncbi:MAG: hypothetical protein IPM07_16915 [Anaerolineales bacterium]|nr:hypothetical protein [Anaerolineales bacterium]